MAGQHKHFVSDPFPIAKWLLWEDFLEKEVPNDEIRFRYLITSFLMAFSGIRIGESRLITVGQIKTLLELGSVRISHVKRLKQEGRVITLPVIYQRKLRELFSLYFSKGIDLLKGKKNRPLFIGSQSGKAITRQHFNAELNKLLIKFAPSVNPSKDYRLTADSFRIGYIAWAEAQAALSSEEIKRILGYKGLDIIILQSRLMTESKQEEILTPVPPAPSKTVKGKWFDLYVNLWLIFFFGIFPFIIGPTLMYLFWVKPRL